MFGGEAAEKPFPVNLIVQRICPVGADVWKRVIEAKVIAVAAGKGLVQDQSHFFGVSARRDDADGQVCAKKCGDQLSGIYKGKGFCDRILQSVGGGAGGAAE